jgi:hypothetical protein
MLGSQFWSVISDPWALVTALWAITLGIIMGALPGITGPMAMALLLGVVYTMTKEYAIVARMLSSRRFRLPFTLTAPSIEARRVLTVFGLVFLYVALMPWIGYPVATFLMLFAFQTIFTAKRDLKFLLIWAGGLSLALTAALYYVFGQIFLIPLP